MTHVGDVPIDEYCPMCDWCDDWETQREEVITQVRELAYHIINHKGATYFAIGMALTRIVGTILQDQRSVLTVSTLLEGEYDIRVFVWESLAWSVRRVSPRWSRRI